MNSAWHYEEGFLSPYRNTHDKHGYNRTADSYASHLRQFALWVCANERDGFSEESQIPLDPTVLTQETLIEYGQYLAEHKSWATTQANTTAIFGFLAHLEVEGVLPDSISISVLRTLHRRRRKRSSRKASDTVIGLHDLRIQKVPEMVNFYHTLELPEKNDRYNRRLKLLRDRALMYVLYATGMRLFEVTTLEAVQFRQPISHLTIVGKGNKQRIVHLQPYVHKPVQDYLMERRQAGITAAPLFVSHSRRSSGKRLTPRSVARIVKKAALSVEAGELSAHDIRHFRATQLLRRGMPLEAVQEFLGHENIATTRDIYAPVLGVASVREQLDRVDDVTFEQLLARHQRDLEKWNLTGDDRILEVN